MTSLVGRLCSSLYRAGSRRLPVAYTSTSSIIFQKGKVKPLDDPSTARGELQRLVKEQLKFERTEFEELPVVPGFQCSVNGAIASFQRSIGGEEIKVVLDVNSKAEIDLMQEPENEEDLIGAASVPAFTVTVKNSSGNSMQLECSFDTVYDEVNDSEEMKLQVDSVCMIPGDCKDSDALYTLPTTELDEDLSSSLEKYMNVRGISPTFGADLLSFFQVFEHNVYVHEFLEKLEQFCAK